MEYRTSIKASGVNNLPDARFFASCQIDWIGLDLDPLSPNGLTIEQAQEIIQWLSHPGIAGEFTNRAMEEVKHISRELHIKGVQIPYEQSADLLQSEDLFVWKYLSLEGGVLPMGLMDAHTDGFVLDLGSTGALDELDPAVQQFLDEACSAHEIWLRAAPSSALIHELLDRFDATGIDLKTGDDVRPGAEEFSATLDLLESLYAQA